MTIATILLILGTVTAILLMRKLTCNRAEVIPMSASYSVGAFHNIIPITKMVITGLLSLSVVGGSIYIILNGEFGDSDKNFAYGTIGTVLGYWLKNESGV